MSEITFGREFSMELESEVRATRKCLESIPDKLYKYKPHEKSMELGLSTFPPLRSTGLRRMRGRFEARAS